MRPRTTHPGHVVVALAFAGAACTRREPPPPPPLPPPPIVDQELVDNAFRDCYLADCERAYAHVADLPMTSPLRSGLQFRAIRYRFDADRLLHSDVEPDLTKRRALLRAVADSPLSDPQLRQNATQRLARVGASGTGQEISLNARSDVPSAAESAATERAELLRKSESAVPADQAEVRAKIEPRVFSGKATAEDVAILKNVCKAQHDNPCLRQLGKLIIH